MPTDNFSFLVDRVSAALDAAALQHQVHASNIANRDSEGHVRLKLAFDRAFGVLEGGAAGPMPPPRPYVIPEAGGQKASLEEDLLAMSKNTMNYQALSKALSRYFSIANAIANGGRS